jgi:hypothetical protein
MLQNSNALQTVIVLGRNLSTVAARKHRQVLKKLSRALGLSKSRAIGLSKSRATWRYVAIFLALTNIKNFPLMWHVSVQ